MTDNLTLANQLEAEIRANRLMTLPVAWQDEIIFPHYDGLSILNIAARIGAIFGLTNGNPPLDERIWQNRASDGEIHRVVMVITDGLGYRWLRQMMAEDEEFAGVIADLTDGHELLPLTSIAPSTTAVALPTLWTAAHPAAHGMVGTWMHLREVSTLADMLSYKPAIGTHPAGILESWGLKPEDFIPVPTLPEMLTQVDVPTHLLMAKNLLGTGLSRIMHRGVAHRYTHAGLTDVWMRLRDVLIATKGQRCYVNTYRDAVDTLSHLYGSRNDYLRNEIRWQLTALRDLLADPAIHDGHTLVMIAADHGHNEAPEIINLADDPVISSAMRETISGDRRFGYVMLREGTRRTVIEHIANSYADKLTWIEPEAAYEAGLFGKSEPSPELFHRIGDLILVPRGGVQVMDSRRPSRIEGMVSMHGGLSDWEMLVPLLWRRI